jgi:hypothetical protein
LAENIPAAQLWQAVDTPSIKYCPALQHTPFPAGVHLIVWPAVQEAVHDVTRDSNRLSLAMDEYPPAGCTFFTIMRKYLAAITLAG